MKNLIKKYEVKYKVAKENRESYLEDIKENIIANFEGGEQLLNTKTLDDAMLLLLNSDTNEEYRENLLEDYRQYCKDKARVLAYSGIIRELKATTL